MREIDAQTAAAYLRETGHLSQEQGVEVRELSGGVSNIVLLVTPAGGESYVLKQARQQLRVPQPWFCGVERVLREIEVLHLCEKVLQQEVSSGEPGGVSPRTSANVRRLTPSGSPDSATPFAQVPRLLYEDRENFLFAMTAAPHQHTTWKQQLIAGNANPQVAAACGQLLGKLHAQTWLDESTARDFDDRQFFDDLRLDPYYRQIAKVHETLAPQINALVDSVLTHRRCLVHGDFSPKNLLVWNKGLMLIDFEVGHYGDPAFDLGFFLTHLVLKTIHYRHRHQDYLALIESFTKHYRNQLKNHVDPRELISLEHRAVQNLAGCMLARVDGKSRVDYSLDEDLVRRLAKNIFVDDATLRNFDSIPKLVAHHMSA